MLVKLKTTIVEPIRAGVDGARPLTAVRTGQEKKFRLKIMRKTEFVKDAVIDMSDATAAKYIELGWAEPVKPTKAETAAK